MTRLFTSLTLAFALFFVGACEHKEMPTTTAPTPTPTPTPTPAPLTCATIAAEIVNPAGNTDTVNKKVILEVTTRWSSSVSVSSAKIDWQDGPVENVANNARPRHEYAFQTTAKSYTPTLTVVASGVTCTASMTPVAVPALPAPTPTPTPTPNPGPTCSDVAPTYTFIAGNTTANEVTLTLQPSWRGNGTGSINWGDGAITAVNNNVRVSHPYRRDSTAHNYVATLTVVTSGVSCTWQNTPVPVPPR